MINNYIKIAWRNLLKSKVHSLINIAGLAIGLSAVLIISLWVVNQFQYDNFYSNKENLYKLFNKYEGDGDVHMQDITSGPAAVSLKVDYPEVRYAARMYWTTDRLFSFGEVKVKAKGNEVDPEFIQLFDFNLIKGNKNQALANPRNIILTESLAKNIFGDNDPMNQSVLIDNKDAYLVSGIMADMPSNSDFDFTYLISLSNADAYSTNWNTNTYYTYVQLRAGTDVAAFNKKLVNSISKKTNNELTGSLFVYPISKMHLYTKFEQGIAVGGKIDQVKLVAGIGILILLIACVNFINLSTARSQKRAKEVAVRKMVGAKRSRLIAQFLTESVVLAFLSAILALGLSFLALPFLNKVLDYPLSISWTDPYIYLTLVCFTLITGLLAGIYPAFLLSSFKPTKALKVFGKKHKYALNLREILVIFQFGIAVILIIATLIVNKQINYAAKRDVGYASSQLIEIPVEGDLHKNYDVLKTELLSNGIAQAVTRTGWSITQDGSSTNGNLSWDGSTPQEADKLYLNLLRGESDLVKTIGLTLSEGRDMDYARLAADSASILLNESAIAQMKLKDPIGKYFKWSGRTYTIVGIFKDFISGDPYKQVSPMMVYPSKEWLLNMVIRTKPGIAVTEQLQQLEQSFKKFNPAYPFTYNFVDQKFAAKFKDQQQTLTLAFIFSALAIFISALGLFGLAAYIAELKTKEIGIRKVLGASVATIATMLSKDFVKLVLLALIIASPIAYWLMKKWLSDFAYSIEISWWIFVIAGVSVLAIAIVTIGSQAIKAAQNNPVNTLRSE